MTDLTRNRLDTVLPPRPFQYFSRIDSTMNFARDWLRDGAPSGAVVIADEQLWGRGRRGRYWHTPPGVALAVSVIMHPTYEALPQIMMLGALAIVDLLDDLGANEVGIKWPNDVLLKNRKVSGVLPETEWEGDTLRGVVLGIGVNVRVDFAGTELENTATSLETELARSLDRTDLLVTLLNRIDHWTAQLATPALFTAWKARLQTLGQSVTVMGDSGIVTGIAQDIDEAGALLVRTASGEVQRVIAGDLS